MSRAGCKAVWFWAAEVLRSELPSPHLLAEEHAGNAWGDTLDTAPDQLKMSQH